MEEFERRCDDPLHAGNDHETAEFERYDGHCLETMTHLEIAPADYDD